MFVNGALSTQRSLCHSLRMGYGLTKAVTFLIANTMQKACVSRDSLLPGKIIYAKDSNTIYEVDGEDYQARSCCCNKYCFAKIIRSF